jgi:hypothetical protein
VEVGSPVRPVVAVPSVQNAERFMNLVELGAAIR